MSEHLRTDRFALHVLGYSFAFFILGDILAEFIPYGTPTKLQHVASALASAGITAPVINAIVLGIVWAAGDNFRVRYLMRNDTAMDARSGFWESVRFAAVARFGAQVK